MFGTTLLGLPECRVAINVMLRDAERDVQQPMAFAIVNDYGELMAFARMDGSTPAVRDFAVKKAYTAARMRADLKDFRAGLEQRGRSVADYADSGMVGMAAGGVVISEPGSGAVLGAIGVSGGTPQQDDVIAHAGLRALLVGG
jgi:uncharacterized protein GlcG (DUF336 family)